jgi:hypothetical protein
MTCACLIGLPACCTDGRDGVGGDRSCHSDVVFMPHKANAARRHIPRPKRRVTNWADHNEALRQRGSLTVWFTDDGVPRTHWQRWQCGAAHEMRGGPSEPAVRGRLQTASSCIGQEPVW